MRDYPELIDIGGGVWSAAVPGMPGNHKVVPADAIVIERSDLPEVEEYPVGDFYVSGFVFPRNKDVSALRDEVLVRLALIEYLTAHPPVDEEQIEAAMPYIEDLIESAGGCRDGWDVRAIARRLVEQGWTKPEVSK